MAKPTQNNPSTRRAEAGGDPRRRSWRRGLATVFLAAALMAYLASGVFVVQPDQRGVVRRFGRVLDGKVQPGVHYAWPWPIGRVDLTSTAEFRALIGLDPEARAAIAAGDLVARGDSPTSDLFTGDVNIVKATLVAQYRIAEPARYVTAATDPDALVRFAVQSAMTEALGGYSIDDALTGGKARVANDVRAAARGMLDRLDVGIALNDVSVESIEPPFAVSDAFKDVASAKKDREKTIDQAHGFAETILPRARGRAAEIVADARSFAEQRRNQAEGQAERFNRLLAEYQKAPKVTRTRLLLATLTRVYERAETYVITPNEEGPPLRLTIRGKE